MKRVISFSVCLILLLVFSGCRSAAVVSPGIYTADGIEYTSGSQTITLTPYLGIDAEDQSFWLGPDPLMSNAETGTYQIKSSKLIAETQNTTLVFEIKDSGTLVLVDDGGRRINMPPLDTTFVLSEQRS